MGRYRFVGSDVQASDDLHLMTKFRSYLSQRFPEINTHNFDASLREIDAQLADPWRCYHNVRPEGLEISYSDGEPRVSQNTFVVWRHLTESVDEDALILHDLVARGYLDYPDLHRWGTITLASDWQIQSTLGHFDAPPQLADTHVHFPGCEPLPISWLRLMKETLAVNKLTAYSPKRQFDPLKTHQEDYEQRFKEKIAINASIKARKDLFSHLATPFFPRARNTCLFPELHEERALIFYAWLAVKNGKPVVSALLDRYLFGKNLFIRRHRQHSESNPGLDEFRRFFDRGKSQSPNKSKRLEWEKVDRMLRFASESPHLRKLSLRIAPFDDLGSYIRFFQLWDKRHQARQHPWLKEREKQLSIGFIIHFIRKPKNPKRKVPEGGIPFEALRRRIERQSAILHFFRRTKPELARYIIGIDVANLERDCPPYLFTPFLKMLRGDFTFERNEPLPFLRTWNRLLSREMHLPSPSLPKLGLTYHAGEDFYTPLDGMEQMEAVIKGAAMTPGDRIGHGLAAGWDLDRFFARNTSLGIPAGTLLDSLTWLWRRTRRQAGSEREMLREVIATLAEDIYMERPGLHNLNRLMELRHSVPPVQASCGSLNSEQRLWEKELFDPACRENRWKLIPLPPRLFECLELMHAARNDFVQQMTKGQIVLEFNPTSNLVTGHLKLLQYHPYFTLREVLGSEPLASFNTDDPGVFHTRIEIEFSQMVDAMRKNKLDMGEIEEAIKRAATIGLFSAFKMPAPKRD